MPSTVPNLLAAIFPLMADRRGSRRPPLPHSVSPPFTRGSRVNFLAVNGQQGLVGGNDMLAVFDGLKDKLLCRLISPISSMIIEISGSERT
jgi:hypothetical protein